MEEESHKKRLPKRDRDDICNACQIIFKVQRKDSLKHTKADNASQADEPGQLQRCQACNRILYDRY